MWKNLMSWINYFLIYKSEVLDSNSVMSADIRSSISVYEGSKLGRAYFSPIGICPCNRFINQ